MSTIGRVDSARRPAECPDMLDAFSVKRSSPVRSWSHLAANSRVPTSLRGEALYEAFSCAKTRFMVHLFYTLIHTWTTLSHAMAVFDRIESWLLWQPLLCPQKRCHFPSRFFTAQWNDN